MWYSYMHRPKFPKLPKQNNMAAKVEKYGKRIVFLGLAIAYLYYIYLAWLKLEKGQVALATSQVHVNNITFPKVAFCLTITNSTDLQRRYEDGGAIIVKAYLGHTRFPISFYDTTSSCKNLISNVFLVIRQCGLLIQ